MERFHIIDDAAVILRSRGVYRQAKVYRRRNDVFAAFGGGFVKLAAQGGTSVPNVSWQDIEAAGVGFVGTSSKPLFQVEAPVDQPRIALAR